VRHLGVSIALLLLLTFTVVVIWILPFTILIMPPVSVWLMTALLEKVFSRYDA